jgi:hypothetical protein
MASNKYRVEGRLDHDNRLYEPGAVVELDDDEAAPLMAAAVVTPAPKDAEPSKGKKK